MKHYFLIMIFFICSFLNATEQGSIVPTPQSVEYSTSQFKITAQTKVILGQGTSEEKFIAQQLNDELTQLKAVELRITDSKSVRKMSSNFVYIGKVQNDIAKKFLKEKKYIFTKEMNDEGYLLHIDRDGVYIIAPSNKGLFYGMMSLLQSLRREKRSIVAGGMTIIDYPSQKIRGITDDVSRGQISTLENFKKIIRFCARYKMNVYSPYIEDVFQFKNHPLIWKGRGALAAAECKELDAYAKKYFVEIIPIFETLGHWENILLLPEYVQYGEFPGAHTVNISDEKVYSLLDEMIGEIAACFSSPYFNMAADESWDVGLGVNADRVSKSDLATVHAEHYKRTFDIIKKHGKKPMMYGDIILNHPEILKKIPKDVTIVDWHYGTSFEYPSTKIFSSEGFPYVVSPAVWNFTGPFPNYLNAFLNIYHLNANGVANGSLGILCSGWNDFGGEALRELNYLGYAWNAECAWNPKMADQFNFEKNFFKDYFGTSDIDGILSTYDQLINPTNQYHWYELWRHPMLPNRDDMIWEKRLPLLQRMQSIQSTMPFVQEQLASFRQAVTRNADHLEYLSFIVRLNLWFAMKVENQIRVQQLIQDTTIDAADRITAIRSRVASVTEELRAIRNEFERIWLKTNRVPSIKLLLQRYDRQIMYWKESLDEIVRGAKTVNPWIESQWIYHKFAHPFSKDTSLTQVRKSYSRKTYSLPAGSLTSAKIQLLGNTWSRLYVNGTFAGEVFARQSLSLTVENARAKIFDVTSLIKDSVLTLCVESQNYQMNGSAGCNVYGEVRYSDGTVTKILSDDSWKVNDTEVSQWTSSQFDDAAWSQGAVFKYPTPVVKPNLSLLRTSWFER